MANGNGVLKGKWNKVLTAVALAMGFVLALLGKDVGAFALIASVCVGGGHVATSVGRARYRPALGPTSPADVGGSRTPEDMEP